MILNRSFLRAISLAAFGFLSLSCAVARRAFGQQQADELAGVPLTEPTSIALPLAEDRGQAALEQTLKRLGTTASLMVIVAHPDEIGRASCRERVSPRV